MNKCGIYKITNLINQKSYIGQSTDILKRWRNHKTDGLNQDSTTRWFNYPLYRAFRAYGLENFSFEIIEECPCFQLNQKEIYWINYYDSYNNGYNQTPGGNNYPHYVKLNEKKVLEIIDLLKTTDDNSETIGEKFGVSGRTIRGINTGEYYRQDNINYPIRPKLYNNGTTKGFVTKIEHFCLNCGRKINNNSLYCVYCSQRKVLIRPQPLELAKMICEKGFAGVGKEYSVNGNTIKKWCENYKIPYKKQELIEWYDAQCKNN